MAPIFHEDNDLPVASFYNPYIGATKKAGEQVCLLYADEYHMSVPIIRPPLVGGPMYRSGLQHQVTMVKNAVEGTATDLAGVYGGTKMVFLYVRDCAKAISLVHLAPSLKHAIYNVSDGETHTLGDFAEVIREFIPSAQIRLGTTRSGTDVDYPETSIERIRQDVGFVPQYDLKRAVSSFIDWLKEGKYA